jgi:LacI family transcriptional regulator
VSITSKEIAEACGVSRGTVDRALNNRPGINEETRKLILETAERLGYRPHFLARSLAKGKTMSIGLVVFDLYNRFFAQMANAIEAAAREHGYFVFLTMTDKNPQNEKDCIAHLVDRKVDGIILSPVNNSEDYHLYLQSLNLPLVTVGNRLSVHFPYIGIHDFQAMGDATKHILSKQYARILYISPPLAYEGKTNIHAQEQRFLGFTHTLANAVPAMESHVIRDTDYTTALDKLLLGDGKKTAILCSSDVFALETLRHLKEKGFRVPEDIGVMGFDNIDVLKYVEPPLATVTYPMEEIGRSAFEQLLALMEGTEKPGDIFLDHRVICGKSL